MPPHDPHQTVVPLPPPSPTAGDAVRWAAALLRDQRERWRAGHRRPVEGYLAGYPHLACHPDVGLMLAAHEFLLRLEAGERPELAEYVRRFPQWSARLADEIAFLHPPGGLPPPSNADGDEWPRLPGYQILAELGRGGMAVVYHARQTALDRSVALKVIAAGELAGTHQRQRMRREAEVVARLRHPNVVHIHDIEEHRGCLYLSLEYVAGGSLDRRLSGQTLPPADAARLVRQLAGGVQAAHDAGIVHRDLKPANVLLDVDGTPKVTDFGLAKQRDEAHRLTTTGTTAGTPSYMAPEQVFPEPEKIGPATDVYGLGAVLYECLTGRPPFTSPTAMETFRQVAYEPVVPVRRLQAGVPPDVESVCLKCLEKDPRNRYPTARDLADDLGRFLAGEPTRARPVGALGQAWRWARRYPLIPLLAVTLGLMTLSVAGLMVWTTYHTYRVTGQLRERELYLHGLRGTLLQLNEAQARYAELAATTGDAAWADRHAAAAAEAGRYHADIARFAPAAAADLVSTAAGVLAGEHRALELVRRGRAADGWAVLGGEEHRRARDGYAAAVTRFADRVDADADADLRAVQAETFWSLASATAVAGLIGVTMLVGWRIHLRSRPCTEPLAPAA